MERILNKLGYKLIATKEIEGYCGKLYYAISNEEFNKLEKDSKFINCQFLERYSKLNIVTTENWIIFRRYSQEKEVYYLQVIQIPSKLKDESLEEEIKKELSIKIFDSEESYNVILNQDKQYDVYEDKFLEKGTLLFPDELTSKFFASNVLFR